MVAGALIPVTQEAEAGESLEPERQMLEWAEILPLYFSLGDRARLHLKQNKTKQNKKLIPGYKSSTLLLTQAGNFHHNPNLKGETIKNYFLKVYKYSLKNSW